MRKTQIQQPEELALITSIKKNGEVERKLLFHMSLALLSAELAGLSSRETNLIEEREKSVSFVRLFNSREEINNELARIRNHISVKRRERLIILEQYCQLLPASYHEQHVIDLKEGEKADLSEKKSETHKRNTQTVEDEEMHPQPDPSAKPSAVAAQ